jgi:hypothetical protein
MDISSIYSESYKKATQYAHLAPGGTWNFQWALHVQFRNAFHHKSDTSAENQHAESNKINSLYTVKDKGFPLQAWNGSWDSRRLRLQDLLDFRHYEGGNVVTLTYRPPSPPRDFLVLIFRGWVDPRAHGSLGSFGKNLQRHHWGSVPRPSD